MAVFKDSKELLEYIAGAWERVLQIPELEKELRKANAVALLRYTDPEAFFYVDCSKDPSRDVYEHMERPAELDMVMSGDFGNKFMCGKTSMPVAMMKGEIKIKGPTSLLFSMLPVVRKSFDIYCKLLEEKGRKDLLEAAEK